MVRILSRLSSIGRFAADGLRVLPGKRADGALVFRLCASVPTRSGRSIEFLRSLFILQLQIAWAAQEPGFISRKIYPAPFHLRFRYSGTHG